MNRPIATCLKFALQRRSLVVFAALSISAFTFAAGTASAGCAYPTPGKSVTLKAPFLNAPPDDTESREDASIVGLWQTHYYVGKESANITFVETLKQWHRDGTEFEEAMLPPVNGNICFGVYKEVGPRTVHLHHIGAQFDASGNYAGGFTEDETDCVSEDGKTYKGTFTFKPYDKNGVAGQEVTGEVVATRFTVD